jgi:hypothetical protein
LKREALKCIEGEVLLYKTNGVTFEINDIKSRELETLKDEKLKLSIKAFKIFQSSRELPGLKSTFLVF